MRSQFSGLGCMFGRFPAYFFHPCTIGEWNLGLSRGGPGHFLPPGPINYPETGGDLDRENRLSRLEAVFFLSQHPQTSRKLAQLAGLADGTKARTLIRSINLRYDTEGHAFRIEEVAGGYQLMTRSKFAPWLRRLHSVATEVRLSAPAMETLAVVAYRQPVLRADIEAVRGVQSGEVLRQLIERDLVKITGRSDELGRPFLYGTTKHFLQVFGLRHLEELPRTDVLRPGQTSALQQNDTLNESNNGISNPSNTTSEAEEETNVRTSIITKPRRSTTAESNSPTGIQPRRDNRLTDQDIFAKGDEDEEAEDEDDDEYEDDEDFEDEDDEDLDDEPWEEVDDEDEDLDDDEDEEWDDDEDWDDDDDDWDDDEDEEDDEDEDE